MVVTGTKMLSVDIIQDVLSQDFRVVFAYLYGSFGKADDPKDVDIAVYAAEASMAFSLPVDLKIAMSQKTGMAPEAFDIKVINSLPENGDLFSLLYLKAVFEDDRLLVDKDFAVRTCFIEAYSRKYRECQGLFQEVLV